MAPLGLFGVELGGQHTVRANKGAVANGNAAQGEEGATEVEKAVAPKADAGAIVDVEWGKDANVVGHVVARNLAQQVAHLGLGVPAAVECGCQPHGALHFGIEVVATYVFLALRGGVIVHS